MGGGVAICLLLMLAAVLAVVATVLAVSKGTQPRKALPFGCLISLLAVFWPTLLFTVLIVAPHL